MEDEAPKLLKRREAKQRLKVPEPVFNALWTSNLLGLLTSDGMLPEDGVEHYERYGTQWLTQERYGDDLGVRMVPEDLYQSLPPIPGVGEQPPGTQARAHVLPEGVSEDAMKKDTGWLAQFYLTPNFFFFPNPTDMAMIGFPQLKLDAPKQVKEATLSTCLYPNPTGSLAMVSVFGIGQSNVKAFEIAYDVAGPILDELSFKYDVPLPIVHTLIVGIPSGVLYHYFPVPTKNKKLERAEVVEPYCPYPELRDAVALYREAASSNNPFHSFLTFWKVYENVVKDVRRSWGKENRRGDTKIQEEIIPHVFAFGAEEEQILIPYGSDEEEKDRLKEETDFKGLSFEQTRQKLYRPYRVALAHAGEIREGGKLLTAASADDLAKVATKVPIVRYMARVVLTNMRVTLASERSE